VFYDTMQGTAHAIKVSQSGTLEWDTTQSTRLTVVTLFIVDGGRIQIGTATQPLPPQVTAEIVIRDVLTNSASDPDGYGTGVLVLDGSIILRGATRAPGFMRLATEAKAGDLGLTLMQAVAGWQPGDTVELPDSRQWTDNTIKGPYYWETRTVSALSGTTMTLDTALAHHHPGARDSLVGTLDFTPHVANLTRNIVIRSENPQGTRGHVWLSRGSVVDIQYARFQELGRTTIAPIGPANHIGRYPLHLHHLHGSAAALLESKYPFILRGNVVHGGDVDHRYKWGIVVHDTHYGLVQDNIVYNVAGGAFTTEDGSEYQNIFEGNLALRIGGDGNRMGEGTEATGFWFRGGQNIVRRNIAASIPANGPGVQHCGYSVWQQYVGQNGNVRIPLYAGADTATDGQYRVINLYETPLAEFTDNEVYTSACGVTMWWLGSEFTRPRAQADSIVSELKSWNIHSYHWLHYHAHRLIIDGWKARGTPILGSCCQAFYHGADYFASDWTLQNGDLQGSQDGIIVSTDTTGQQVIRNTRLAVAGAGIRLPMLWTSSHTPKGLLARSTLIDNVRVDRILGSAFSTITREYNDTPVRALIRPDIVAVRNYQQLPGNDFQVYYREQAPGFIVPQTTMNTDGTPQVEGAPVAGLTNAQAWQAHSIAIAGAVAPCADARAEIRGFVCGAMIPPPPVDTEPPTTPGSLTGIPSTTSIILMWQPSMDNVGVTGYRIARDGLAITSATATSYKDDGLAPSTEYTYTVRAQDASGNLSPPAQAIIMTLALPPPGWEPKAGYIAEWRLTDGTQVSCSAEGSTAKNVLVQINNCIAQ
jgi:hypothetical protein